MHSWFHVQLDQKIFDGLYYTLTMPIKLALRSHSLFSWDISIQYAVGNQTFSLRVLFHLRKRAGIYVRSLVERNVRNFFDIAHSHIRARTDVRWRQFFPHTKSLCTIESTP